MNLRLERFISDDDTTISSIAVDTHWNCFGCEDEFRAVKVAKETRIPAGTYRIKLRAEGGFHERYLAKFGPQFHKGMLWLQDVPNFQWVLIHIGNTDEDTEGCILVGATANTVPGSLSIGNSLTAYQKLYPVVRDALLRGEAVQITVVDKDRG
jgi:hypothetical protein